MRVGIGVSVMELFHAVEKAAGKTLNFKFALHHFFLPVARHPLTVDHDPLCWCLNGMTDLFRVDLAMLLVHSRMPTKRSRSWAGKLNLALNKVHSFKGFNIINTVWRLAL